MKHLPGHARARADSHLTLPVVEDDEAEDLEPFIHNAGLPWAMTAHIVFPKWDAAHPATQSASVISRIIRGRIGFQGLLLSDDLAMHALSGLPAERAALALAAGCDIALYCPGDAEGNEAVLASCGEVSDRVVENMAAAAKMAQQRKLALVPDDLAAERDALLR
jgi:beta-N-acetylhexosaminidase